MSSMLPSSPSADGPRAERAERRLSSWFKICATLTCFTKSIAWKNSRNQKFSFEDQRSLHFVEDLLHALIALHNLPESRRLRTCPDVGTKRQDSSTLSSLSVSQPLPLYAIHHIHHTKHSRDFCACSLHAPRRPSQKIINIQGQKNLHRFRTPIELICYCIIFGVFFRWWNKSTVASRFHFTK